MRRLAATVAAGALLALPGGTALAATTQPSAGASASGGAASSAPASGPASATPLSSAGASGTPAPAPAASANPLCTAEVVDNAGVLSGDDVEQLRSAGADLAQTTVLRIRTVSGLSSTDGDLTAVEGQLEKSCGWVDASSQRLPTLLVVMVDTDNQQVGIFPGPSLASLLTDKVLQAIEQDTMRPAFAGAHWTAGLQAGVAALAQLVGPNAAPSASFDPSALASAAAAASGNASAHPSSSPATGAAVASPPASSGSGFPYAVVLGVVAAVVVIGAAVFVYRRVSLRRGFATEAAWDAPALDDPEEPDDEPGEDADRADGEEPSGS